MALETLKDVTEIGGFKVLREKPYDMDWDTYDSYRKENPILITNRLNMISFRIQDGPIKEHGVNGCQVDTLIEAAKMIIEGLNKNFPCQENYNAISRLEDALMWLGQRKKNREQRGVEGLNKE